MAFSRSSVDFCFASGPEPAASQQRGARASERPRGGTPRTGLCQPRAAGIGVLGALAAPGVQSGGSS